MPPSFGRFFHGLRNFPSDVVTIVLSLGLFRMLRGGAGLETGSTLIESLRAQPAAFANTIAVVAFLGSATLVVPWTLFGTSENLSLLPFLPSHFLLATVFWAARGTQIDWNRLFRISGGDRLPWPVALATIALAVSLMPAIDFEFGVLRLKLFGRSVVGAIGLVAAVWLYHRLGRGLARLVPIMIDPGREPIAPPEFDAKAALRK